MKKILLAFITGIITGIILLYAYYTYKYAKFKDMVINIIYHEYNFTIFMLKIVIFVILTASAIMIIIPIAYYTWTYLIQRTHKEIKSEKQKIKRAYQKFQEEKQKLEEEKRTIHQKMQEELKQYKNQIEDQANKEVSQTKEQIKNQYQKVITDLEIWKKQEKYEKERLKQKIKCLEEKIYEIFTKKAEKFRETNPGRYNKELKKAKKIIEECKKPNS